ncbi:DUF1353 domain-containing protein [Pseudomonas vranovensis]|uniref:DUF1353 domain-containing protein n=1 Tax=Pseudomonas vranovensis TaxID=321661 RepID=A0A423DU41_9PSED|nr:DUF1353 domain-containing protein [Pseudomonas vranovensis]ROL75572.1 hypothetical protein BHU25_09225 [Pseudomonas vranovensis]
MASPPDINRRALLTSALKASSYLAVVGAVSACQPSSEGELIERWMADVTKKAPNGSLHVSRFMERIWFLTRTIGWTPDQPDEIAYNPVNVPRGFVTDFASTPRLFWALLPPDDRYTYPAIVHDYLYWAQDRPREEADQIFDIGMSEFGVSRVTRWAVYNAVRLFGSRAWEQNAELKAQGEKRVLARFPKDPLTEWKIWKRDPENFK